MKYFFVALSLFITVSCGAQKNSKNEVINTALLTNETPGAKITGNIGIWHTGRAIALKVELPPFVGGILSNDQMHFQKLPEGMTPDSDGCFCFEPSDDRLAYVHLYYHVTRQIQFFNQLLLQLNMGPIPHVEVSISRDRSAPFSISVDVTGTKMRGTYPESAIDVTLLAHEVGHIIDYAITRLGKVTNSSQSISAILQYALAEGVSEGTANIIAALYLGEPVISRYFFELPGEDINTFVRFPDMVITRRQSMESLSASMRARQRFPEFFKIVDQNLANPSLKEYFAQPDGYHTSAIINQPLWVAAMRFGFLKTQLLYLEALHNLPPQGKAVYNDLARSIVSVAHKTDKDLSAFLEREYRLRGLDL